MIRVLPGVDGCDCRNNSTVIAALAHAMTTVMKIRARMKTTGLHDLPFAAATFSRRSLSGECFVDLSELNRAGLSTVNTALSFDAVFPGSS